MEEFLTRRHKLAAQMQNSSIALLPSAKTQYRNSHTEYPFRQNSDFFYLTGFAEPNAVMALSKDAKGKVSFIMFNQANDPVEEVWLGKRAGEDGARQIYQADDAYDIADIDNVLPNLFADKKVIYYPMAVDQGFDERIMSWLKTAKQNFNNKNYREMHDVTFIPDTVTDLLPFIHELRLIKSASEIEHMRTAAEISAEAHAKLMQNCQPGQNEYQLEAIFNEYCLQRGCRGFAYNAIVAGGNNACTLHYTANDQVLKAGDLLLVDAGGEYNYYASDITRTYPISGKFTPEQKQIYELVLKAQLAGIEQIKPGHTFDMVQTAMVEIIVAGLLALDILHGEVKQLIADDAYKQFYMHSSGHWLGLDVHDVGQYKVEGRWRKFEPGMVLTVEPGIYIADTNTDVDPKWLGIGVRIEDDILVTKGGHEVLSNKAPKSVAEVERAAI
ncbi:MAG TPA: aminopeptidase P N-terminal domain-containing protein [Gammaproteobacteria bacterium]|nr:aminopeptidase P N-terminal domain-containing protein [Gammaproteobacteria bacterium]